MASFRINFTALKAKYMLFKNPAMRKELETIAQQKGILALVTQAIADNFAQNGPGWKPLQPQTIRQSVSKGMRKRLDANANTITKKDGSTKTARLILRKTGLLYKSVTTPGAQGNISYVQGTNLVWGTNLAYAAIHNKGGTISHPGTKNGFGMGIPIPPHQIGIPKREFLVLRTAWKAKLNAYAADLAIKIIKKYIKAGNKK